MTHLGTREKIVYQYVYGKDNYMKKIQKLVFSQVRATALILLNYRYSTTGRLGVNGAIIDHIWHEVLPVELLDLTVFATCGCHCLVGFLVGYGCPSGFGLSGRFTSIFSTSIYDFT